MNLRKIAEQYVSGGFSVIPVSEDKRPLFAALPRGDRGSSWEKFKTQLPDLDELDLMFSHRPDAGIAIIGGTVSRHLVQLDFEGKTGDARIRPVYRDWLDLVKRALADVGMEGCPKFWVCETPSGGFHVRWRVDGVQLPTAPVAKGLATIRGPDDVKTGEPVLLIETRNEGAYALAPPSPGYRTVSGSASAVPWVTADTHQILMDLAMSFDVGKKATGPAEDSPQHSQGEGLDRPGSDYNERGDWRAMLTDEGWRLAHTKGEVEYWCRPGKDSGWSANWNYVPNRFHVFSSSVERLEHRGTYDPFGLYARLKYDGDFVAATKSLALEGFGTPRGVSAQPAIVGEPAVVGEPASVGEPAADFPEAGFRGVFRVYRQAYQGCNEVCDAYHFAVLKTVIGAILGRGCYVYAGRRLYPAFYSCILGPTGISRKSTALDLGIEILRDADAEVSFLSALSTPEGLVSKLATSGSEDDFIPSETEGRRLLVGLQEYAALLKKAKKQSSEGLIQLLTEAYDSPKQLDNPTRHSPLVAEHPSVSVVALSTLEWLESSLTLGDIQGGFANRFCYYEWQETQSVPRPSRARPELIEFVVDVIRGVRARFVGKHQEFVFSEEAGERVDTWYVENRKRILNERNEVLRLLSQRLDVNVRRLSLLYAALENDLGSHEIGIEQFEAALTVASYWRDVMLNVFSKFAVDLQSKNEGRILAQVTANPDWTKREIQRSLSREMSAKDFNTCVEAMLVAEMIEVVEDGRRRSLRAVIGGE